MKRRSGGDVGLGPGRAYDTAAQGPAGGWGERPVTCRDVGAV